MYYTSTSIAFILQFIIKYTVTVIFYCRCLLVYKESDKEFRTARTYPKMVLIEVTTNDPDIITINAPGMGTLNVNVTSLDNANKPDKIT